MAFFETPRFPTDISANSVGGPVYSTDIVVTGGGYESRNQNWSYPLHQYDVAYGIKDVSDLETLIEYFHVMRARIHGFRYKDWADYKSCAVGASPAATDQLLGTATAGQADFQIVKNYDVASPALARVISKPVTGTVLVALDDVPQGSGWTVDTTTGIITFAPALSGGEVVKAGYEFDVPVRFGSDTLQVSLLLTDIGSSSVPVTEIRI